MKINKFKTKILFFLIIASVCVYVFLKFKSQNLISLVDTSEIFNNAYFDIHNDDNQFLDVIETLEKNKKMDTSTKILIHVDVHSDLYINNLHLSQGYESVGNWIDPLISEGQIEEIYWVLPDETMSKEYKPLFWDTKTPGGEFWGGPSDQVFWVDPNGQIYFDNDPKISGERSILFHKRLMSQMPSFAGKNNVMLNIDFDYFDFNGNQASEDVYIHNSSKEKLDIKLLRFIDELKKTKVKPILVTFSRSQEYTAGFGHELEKFARVVGLNAKYGFSYLFAYRHSNHPWGQTKPELSGENITREQDVKGIYFYLMETVDMVYGNDDKIIDIAKPNQELDLVIKTISKYTKLNQNESFDVIRGLSQDGKTINLPMRDEMYY